MTDERDAIAAGAIGAPGANAVDRLIVVFRNDDPSAESDVAHERRINELFERYGVPQTIGVIPNCTVGDRHDPRPSGERALDENPAMVAELRRHCAAVGSEIALHGFMHRTSPRSMPKRREYFEFRDESASAQAKKLAAGLAIIERALGVRPVTFIPPWNRMDTATARACRQTGLTIASAGVYTPVVDGVVGLGTDCDLFNFPEFFERALRSERRVYLRILFHSRTTRTAEEIAALERALQLVTQTPGCKAMTLAGAVERFRDEIQVVNEAGKNVAPQDMVEDRLRGMAVPCRKVFGRLRLGDPSTELYAQAETAYRAGRYGDAAALSRPIDNASSGLIGAWLMYTYVSMCIAGFVVRLPVQKLYADYRGHISIVVSVMILAGMILPWWRATAAATRKMCLLTGVGAVAALNSGYWGLSYLLGVGASAVAGG